MQCPRCQHVNSAARNACAKCGAGLPHQYPPGGHGRPASPGRGRPRDDSRTSEAGLDHEELGRLVEPYTARDWSAPRWLLLGVLAAVIVGLLGAGFLSGTGLLTRYSAKGAPPAGQPPAQTELEDPAALAGPPAEGSGDVRR